MSSQLRQLRLAEDDQFTLVYDRTGNTYTAFCSHVGKLSAMVAVLKKRFQISHAGRNIYVLEWYVVM
jgi:hypothetical protein